MIVTKRDLPAFQNIFFCSDIHLGHAHTDVIKFIKDMDVAKARDARILMIGDIFDAVFSKDRRYKGAGVIPEIATSDSQVNAAVDYVYNLLEPYANLIDMISLGNHETAIIKYNEVNPITMLVDKLNANTGSNIAYGGWAGYILYTLRDEHEHVGFYRVLYEHGAGGSAPVTKGMIKFNRKKTQWGYDIFATGHDHNRIADSDMRADVTNTGKLKYSETRSIRCGSYLPTYADKNGHISYAEQMGLPISTTGGIMVSVELCRDYRKDFHSTYIKQTVEL